MKKESHLVGRCVVQVFLSMIRKPKVVMFGYLSPKHVITEMKIYEKKHLWGSNHLLFYHRVRFWGLALGGIFKHALKMFTPRPYYLRKIIPILTPMIFFEFLNHHQMPLHLDKQFRGNHENHRTGYLLIVTRVLATPQLRHISQLVGRISEPLFSCAAFFETLFLGVLNYHRLVPQFGAYLDVFKMFFLFTKVNHHETTIWWNIFGIFVQASNKQIQKCMFGSALPLKMGHPKKLN